MFKTFLLWLMIVALPIQGFAAVSSSAHGSQQTAAAELVSVASMQASHEHHHATEHLATMEHASVADTVHDHTDGHASSVCSSCQSCCVGLGLVSVDLSWQAPLEAGGLPVATLQLAFTGHIPQGLERPPRISLI